MDKQCQVCKRTFTVRTKWSLEKRAKAKWCSQKCYHASWTPERRATIAKTARAYISSETPEQRKVRMAKVIESRNKNGIWKPPMPGQMRDENYAWLGDNATYNAKHRWIQKHWAKTGICANCGKKPRPFGNRRYGTEWANLDGNYDRDDQETWKELCVPCHRRYDINKMRSK